MFQQNLQRAKRAVLQLDPGTLLPQFSRTQVDLEYPKADGRGSRAGAFHDLPARSRTWRDSITAYSEGQLGRQVPACLATSRTPKEAKEVTLRVSTDAHVRC